MTMIDLLEVYFKKLGSELENVYSEGIFEESKNDPNIIDSEHKEYHHTPSESASVQKYMQGEDPVTAEIVDDLPPHFILRGKPVNSLSEALDAANGIVTDVEYNEINH